MSNQQETEVKNIEQGSEEIIKEQDIPQEEKAFLTDTSPTTVWMKTKTGKDYCKMNMIRAIAKVALPLFERLKHSESMELLNFKFTYYDQTDQAGNKIPDGVGSVYRYPKGSGSIGGKPQFKPKYVKEFYRGLTEDTNELLAQPNSKWVYKNSFWDEEKKVVIILVCREETAF
jgi:hypothetical protein